MHNGQRAWGEEGGGLTKRIDRDSRFIRTSTELERLAVTILILTCLQHSRGQGCDLVSRRHRSSNYNIALNYSKANVSHLD